MLTSGTVVEAAARLRPGQYLWAPQVAPSGAMVMIVNLETQRATVYRNGVPIGITTVSSGRRGHETPPGVYTILQKDADHRSSLYDDAPMPFMQRLTWDGIALHGGLLRVTLLRTDASVCRRRSHACCSARPGSACW